MSDKEITKTILDKYDTNISKRLNATTNLIWSKAFMYCMIAVMFFYLALFIAIYSVYVSTLI